MEGDQPEKKRMKIEVKKEANNGFDFVLKGGLVMSDDIDDLKNQMKTDFETMKKTMMEDAQAGVLFDVLDTRNGCFQSFFLKIVQYLNHEKD